ncbi:MAG: hypothetical protein ACUVS4_04015 [Chloroflexaceae bacterium]
MSALILLAVAFVLALVSVAVLHKLQQAPARVVIEPDTLLRRRRRQ